MALEEIRKARLKKLENIKKAGVDPYPAESFRSHKILEALDNFDKLSESGEKITLAGRLMSLREQIEDIVRRSAVNYKAGTDSSSKVDDKLVEVFSRHKK